MPVFDLYSHRKRVAEENTPDVLVYDELPQFLIIQIVHIWRDAIGANSHMGRFDRKYNKVWEAIHDVMAREHGLLTLGGSRDNREKCENFLLSASTLNMALDIIELSFVCIGRIDTVYDESDRGRFGIRQRPDDATWELNERFRRAGVGYQFDDGKIFRIDSELIHTEVVKPTLRYLNESGFEGPRDEFLRAHGHYRSGEMEDAVTDANNAFESTLKAVCDQRGWTYSKGSRASDLIKIVRKAGLLPDYLDNSFDQLVATLQSGLPKVRGEEGAHGQGAKPRRTPDYVGAYALHLAAAKILFVVEAHKSLG